MLDWIRIGRTEAIWQVVLPRRRNRGHATARPRCGPYTRGYQLRNMSIVSSFLWISMSGFESEQYWLRAQPKVRLEVHLLQRSYSTRVIGFLQLEQYVLSNMFIGISRIKFDYIGHCQFQFLVWLNLVQHYCSRTMTGLSSTTRIIERYSTLPVVCCCLSSMYWNLLSIN